MREHTRRTFLKAGAAAALASLTKAQRLGAGGVPSLNVAIAPALNQFEYGDVELLEGPMRQQFDANHAFFLALDEDMLLKPFRQRAGQPAPGDDMGGWYDNSAEF
ncbi:MAG: twin-arginine translocation signal domain-containing protein, partial [Terracidiphilus sp.]